MLDSGIRIEDLLNQDFTGCVAQLEFRRVDGGDGRRRDHGVVDIVIADDHHILRNGQPEAARRIEAAGLSGGGSGHVTFINTEPEQGSALFEKLLYQE